MITSSASKKYATAFRCSGLEEQWIDQGELKGVYNVDPSPWYSSRPSTPSSTQLRGGALFGPDVLQNARPYGYGPSRSPTRQRPSSSAEDLQAWVNVVAPHIVYDGARAEYERQHKLDSRDLLASRWRAKAVEREAAKPKPPPSHRALKELVSHKLSEYGPSMNY